MNRIHTDVTGRVTQLDIRYARANVNHPMDRWVELIQVDPAQHVDEAIFLEEWGLSVCPTCGTSLFDCFEDGLDRTVVQAIGCIHCMLFCARVRNRDGQWFFFDNFSGGRGFLPLFMEPSLRSTPPVVSDGSFLGIHWTQHTYWSLYPYGLQLFSRLFDGSRFATYSIGHYVGMLPAWPVPTKWPSRMGISNGWLVIDIDKHPLARVRSINDWYMSQSSRWGRAYDTNPLRHSARLGITLATAMFNPTNTNDHFVKSFQEAVKALGFINHFDQAAWQAKVAQVLSPLGDPKQVLAPRKVLRAGGK